MAAYSFIDVTASYVGPTGAIDLGYGEATAEEGISFTAAEDKNVMVTGAGGEGMHTLRATTAGTLTVTLLKTSAANKKLQNDFNLASSSSRTWGIGVITVRNSASKDLAVFRECAYKRQPDFNNAKDGDTVQWQFDCVKGDIYRGEF